MDDSKSGQNRRKEDRMPFHDNVYVVIDTQPEMMGQMVELSSTGMAFTFMDLEVASRKLSGRDYLHVDLFAAGKGYFLRNLPARIVSNIGTSAENEQSSLKVRRIGVEFVQPTLAQQVRINSLIRQGHGQFQSGSNH